jgi:hypothetical protein
MWMTWAGQVASMIAVKYYVKNLIEKPEGKRPL